MSAGKYWLVAGAGFLVGSVGLKAATSETARRGYVHALARGMKAKAGCQDLVEQAKAEYDDMVAEASYLADKDDKAQTA